MDKILTEDIKFVDDTFLIQSWSLPKTLAILTVIVSIYLLLVLKIIPFFMKNRPPFKLTRVLVVNNVVQVLLSVYIVAIFTRYTMHHGIITTSCPRGDKLRQVLKTIIPYFIAKHLDLLDTVFFALRKKDNQITFLHLYHHVTMLGWTWLHVMYHVTDNFVIVGTLNSFVHILMYGYYALSALGPKFSKYLWWKKHLTKVQLIQFLLVLSNLHYQQKLSPCPIPQFFHFYCMGVISSFFFLFLNFYFRSYRKLKIQKSLETNNCNSLNKMLILNKEIKTT